MMMTHVNRCDVCHKDKESFVHSSSFAAYSYASCRDCLALGAEPVWVFEYLRDFVDSPSQDALVEEVYNGSFTYWNDHYVLYKYWLKSNPRDEEALQKELNDYFDTVSKQDMKDEQLK